MLSGPRELRAQFGINRKSATPPDAPRPPGRNGSRRRAGPLPSRRRNAPIGSPLTRRTSSPTEAVGVDVVAVSLSGVRHGRCSASAAVTSSQSYSASRQLALDRRQAGAMGQQHAHRDLLLAGRRELASTAPGASSSTAPRATSISTHSAAIGLPTENTLTSVSWRHGRERASSVQPAHRSTTGLPRRSPQPPRPPRRALEVLASASAPQQSAGRSDRRSAELRRSPGPARRAA